MAEIETKLQSPEVWADQKLASELGQESKEIKQTLDMVSMWDTTIEDAETAYELGDEELISEIDSSLLDLEKSLDKFDFQKMLSGEYDSADAILTVNATNFTKLINGKLDPVIAFTTGKLKVDGDVNAALELIKFIK